MTFLKLEFLTVYGLYYLGGFEIFFDNYKSPLKVSVCFKIRVLAFLLFLLAPKQKY